MNSTEIYQWKSADDLTMLLMHHGNVAQQATRSCSIYHTYGLASAGSHDVPLEETAKFKLLYVLFERHLRCI